MNVLNHIYYIFIYLIPAASGSQLPGVDCHLPTRTAIAPVNIQNLSNEMVIFLRLMKKDLVNLKYKGAGKCIKLPIGEI